MGKESRHWRAAAAARWVGLGCGGARLLV
uniref:Uncharacterized protein n=1 Tax=Arundo donax TaxID=35708 RepID=A0A0A9H136_ARUDO